MPAYPAPTSADRGSDYFGSDGPEKPAMGKDEMREHQDDKEMAELPKSFFGGKDLKPGTVCEVRIERVLDDTAMVSYVPHKDEQAEEETEQEPTPPPPSDGGDGSMFG